jgi:hypothetical protein
VAVGARNLECGMAAVYTMGMSEVGIAFMPKHLGATDPGTLG